MEEKVYGLLGRKLSHSYSVPIHRAFGNEAYQLIELEPAELGAFLCRKEIGGLNVTIPYKRDVIAYCDELSPEAKAIGSVNTLVRRVDGKLCGWNTDAYGFSFLARHAGIRLAGEKVVVLGSGGSSRTVCAVARQEGAREIVVISRNGPDNYENLSRHSDAGVVVNTTPVGMYPSPGAAPVDLRAFPVCRGVLDLIYNPSRTRLLMQAEKLDIARCGGLPMLVAQAKAAEEIFFDVTIAEEQINRILRQLRQEMQNMVLIGMPGCGKSTIGAILATLTGREAIDVDEQIAKAAGCSIPQIFAQEGEAAFRQLEWEQTAKAGMQSGKVIVTGGGVVKDERNYASLHQNGRIYQITRDVESLPREGRPLSQNADLIALYQERLPLYTRFRDAVVDNGGAAEQTAAAIWGDFCENSGG